jgi:hypothetical protein
MHGRKSAEPDIAQTKRGWPPASSELIWSLLRLRTATQTRPSLTIMPSPTRACSGIRNDAIGAWVDAEDGCGGARAGVGEDAIAVTQTGPSPTAIRMMVRVAPGQLVRDLSRPGDLPQQGRLAQSASSRTLRRGKLAPHSVADSRDPCAGDA